MKITFLFGVTFYLALLIAAPVEYWFSPKLSKDMQPDNPLKIWTFAKGKENWIVPPARQGEIKWNKSGHLNLSTTVKQGKVNGRIFTMFVPYRPLPGEQYLVTAYVQGTGELKMGIAPFERDAKNNLKSHLIWSKVQRLTGKRQKLLFAPNLSNYTALRVGIHFELVSQGRVNFDQISLATIKDRSQRVSANMDFAAIPVGENYPNLSFKVSSNVKKVQFFPGSLIASSKPIDLTPNSQGIVEVPRNKMGTGKRFVLASNGNTAVTNIEVLQPKEYNKFDTLAKSIKIKKPLNILVIGDSLLDKNFYCNADTGAIKQLYFWLNKYNPKKVVINNVAVRGDYIQRVWDRMSVELKQQSKRVYQQQAYNKLFSFPADIIFIQLGHNDTRTSSLQDYKIPLVPKDQQEKLYIKTLETFRKAFPKSKIVLVSSTSSNYDQILINHQRAKKYRPKGPFVIFGKPNLMEDFNFILRKISPQFNAIYYDIYTEMKALTPKKKATLFDIGGVHLTNEGQKYLAYQYLKMMADFYNK